MKRLIIITLLLSLCSPVFADYVAKNISWPGWSIASSEGLFEKTIHTSFPLTYLMDGDPKTAWVFSGGGKQWDPNMAPYTLEIIRESLVQEVDEYETPPVIPVTIDSIRIMNGYNRSKELFLRNNRIFRLKLYIDDDKPLKTVSLTDKMGWHTISVPRKPVKHIKLEFTDFYKGRDNDICISEIELWDRGKKIDVKMPIVVLLAGGGDECGCGTEFTLIKRDGRRITSREDDPLCVPVWSPNGKLVAGIDSSKNYTLWVIESKTGKKIYSKSMPEAEGGIELSWKNNSTVQVPIDVKPGKITYKYVVLVGY